MRNEICLTVLIVSASLFAGVEPDGRISDPARPVRTAGPMTPVEILPSNAGLVVIWGDGRVGNHPWRREEPQSDFLLPDVDPLNCAFAVEPEGRRLAVCPPDGPCTIHSLPEGRVTRSVQLSDADTKLCGFGPEGQWLYGWSYFEEAAMRVRATDGRIERCDFTDGSPADVTFSADGRAIRLWYSDGEVRVIDWHGRRLWGERSTMDQPGPSASWPDVRAAVATATSDWRTAMVAMQSRAELWRFDAREADVVAVAADGQTALAYDDDGALWIWKHHDGRVERTSLQVEQEGDWAARFSPDGRWLVLFPEVQYVEVGAGHERLERPGDIWIVDAADGQLRPAGIGKESFTDQSAP